MTTATRTRKPRKPRRRPARSASLHTTGGQRIVGLTVGADTTFYRLEALAADFGAGYRLHKADDGSGQEPETYDVLLDGSESRCTCRGYERYGMCRDGKGCKHIAGLQALVSRGLLSSPRRPVLPTVEAPAATFTGLDDF